jgi:hypothetical protein
LWPSLELPLSDRTPGPRIGIRLRALAAIVVASAALAVAAQASAAPARHADKASTVSDGHATSRLSAVGRHNTTPQLAHGRAARLGGKRGQLRPDQHGGTGKGTAATRGQRQRGKTATTHQSPPTVKRQRSALSGPNGDTGGQRTWTGAGIDRSPRGSVHRTAPAGHHTHSRPVAASGPVGDNTNPVVRPFRRLGDEISRVPGFSIFGGPDGWVFTALLLLAVGMIAASLLLGRRPAGRHAAS